MGVPIHAALIQRGRVGQRHVRLLRGRRQRRRRPLCPQLRDQLVQQVHVAGVASVLRGRRLHEGGCELRGQRARQLGDFAGRRVRVPTQATSVTATPVQVHATVCVCVLTKRTAKSRGTLLLRPCCYR